MLNFLFFAVIGLIFFLPALRSLKQGHFKRAGILGLLGLAALAGIHIWSDVYLESLWYDNLGYTSRYWKVLFLRAELFLAGGFIAISLCAANVLFWYHGLKPAGPSPARGSRSRLILLAALFLQIPVFIVSGTISSAHWNEVLLFLNAVPFGREDPVFLKDIGFYIFSLPLWNFVVDSLSSLFTFSLLLVGGLYVTENIFFRAFSGLAFGNFTRNAFAHRLVTQISANFVFGTVVFIARTFIARYELLYSHRGVVYGAGWTDLHAQLPAYNVALVALVGCLVLFLYASFTSSTRRTVVIYLASAALLGSIWIVGLQVIPQIIQHFRVAPNELPLESPYLERNIQFTKEAYGLTNVAEIEFPVNPSPGGDLAQSDLTIINSIRLWSPDILKAVNDQTQFIRLYYNFPDVDVDRYMLNGKLTQLMLSLRELNVARLAAQSRTFQNETMIYTHGYGDVAAPVNRFTHEGLPEYYIKDIPPVSSYPELRLEQPRIYFGEETFNHVYVNTRLKEFDYPKGDTNAQNTYAGSGGVKIDSFLKKLAVSMHFDGLRLFTTQELTPESRILFLRDISRRVRTIAPFLTFDNDMYHVIANGKIYFIWDAYTTAETYPYSQPTIEKTNYIRNSVKVVVDAYEGSTDFYIADQTDPIIRAYARAFPKLFKPFEAMPQALKAHVRYPEDLLSVQSHIYAIYHMADPGVFYNREDAWEISRVAVRQEEAQPILPYYLISRLPGSDREEFVLTLPFSPYSTDKSSPRNNMVAMIMARCDGNEYGKLMLFKFPKDRQVYGPLQIGIRINQDETISKDLTLWNQQGSQVRFGNLLAVPLSGYRLMYIQSIYIQAAVGKMPELRRVVVVFGDQLSYGASFEEALSKFFPQLSGPAGGSIVKPETKEEKKTEIKDLVAAAARTFENYRNLMGKGKYEEAGKALEDLGRLLNQMK
ncbi:MAG: UPF0182 family protein [Nitrospiraceae bacterium]|nr:UPF0182 family protein [Nitrospiraceae bacterium]